jgi:hypothetical protein
MTISVSIQARIERAVDVVFDRVADLDRWPEWLIASGIVAVERAATQPPAAGERLRIRQTAAGRSGTFDVTVDVVERPTRFAVSGRDGDGVTIEIEASLAPHSSTADGGTDLDWSIAIGLPLRYRFLESLAAPQVQRAAALDIEALRRRLEAADPPPAVSSR